jgi:hypothetical protein
MVPGVQGRQVSESLGNEDEQTQAFIHFLLATTSTGQSGGTLDRGRPN